MRQGSEAGRFTARLHIPKVCFRACVAVKKRERRRWLILPGCVVANKYGFYNIQIKNKLVSLVICSTPPTLNLSTEHDHETTNSLFQKQVQKMSLTSSE
jgi:hypothetical protein